MSDFNFAELSDELTGAPALAIQVLTRAELDAVAGGGPFFGDEEVGGGCTCGTRSFCSSDGTDEPD